MKLADAAPLATATAIAAVMLWLGQGPFEGISGRGTKPRPLVLHEPSGESAEFPRRFAWEEVPGTTYYEITVGDEERGTLLFRQRGALPGVDLQFDDGAEPPPGRYVWEVIAVADSATVARGVGRFTVGSSGDAGGSAP